MPGTVTCLALLPGGKHVLTGHYGSVILLWGIDSAALVAEYVDAPGNMSANQVWCSPDGSLIAATGTKGAVTFWPTIPGESSGAATSAGRVGGWKNEPLSLKDTSQ
jgi:hypothetical protein